jgi:hypothetical protein
LKETLEEVNNNHNKSNRQNSNPNRQNPNQNQEGSSNSNRQNSNSNQEGSSNPNRQNSNSNRQNSNQNSSFAKFQKYQWDENKANTENANNAIAQALTHTTSVVDKIDSSIAKLNDAKEQGETLTALQEGNNKRRDTAIKKLEALKNDILRDGAIEKNCFAKFLNSANKIFRFQKQDERQDAGVYAVLDHNWDKIVKSHDTPNDLGKGEARTYVNIANSKIDTLNKYSKDVDNIVQGATQVNVSHDLLTADKLPTPDPTRISRHFKTAPKLQPPQNSRQSQ